MELSLVEEDATLGNWPRRLLHVPSLISHEWQPGNVYGGVAAPLYNAISYTWGRWRLTEMEKRHVQALEVHGVSWPIPRVDPAKFTADQLKSVLEKERISTPRYMTKKRYQIVEFVWLDIACIGQPFEDKSSVAELFQRRSAAEIGR